MAYQDFTTFTETDAGGKLTVTSTKIDIANLLDSDVGKVYKDMGANHFDGNFEHLVEMYMNSATTTGYRFWAWGLANITTLQESSPGTQYLSSPLYREGATDVRVLIRDVGSQQGVFSLSQNTLYYVKIKRDEAVGTYGTAYVYVYSDSARTSLIGSNSILIANAKYDFRYLYGMTGFNAEAGTFTTSGYVQNLDIQEAAPAAAAPTTRKRHIWW